MYQDLEYNLLFIKQVNQSVPGDHGGGDALVLEALLQVYVPYVNAALLVSQQQLLSVRKNKFSKKYRYSKNAFRMKYRYSKGERSKKYQCGSKSSVGKTNQWNKNGYSTKIFAQ